jgi:hypothetical protein
MLLFMLGGLLAVALLVAIWAYIEGWQLKVELMHESFQSATYSDGYYYAD